MVSRILVRHQKKINIRETPNSKQTRLPFASPYNAIVALWGHGRLGVTSPGAWRPGRMASGPRSPQFPGQLGGTAAPQSFPQASARGIRARASWRAASGLRSRQARAPRPVGVGAKPRMSSEIPAAGSGRWQRLSSFVLEPKLPFLSPTSQGCV